MEDGSISDDDRFFDGEKTDNDYFVNSGNNQQEVYLLREFDYTDNRENKVDEFHFVEDIIEKEEFVFPAFKEYNVKANAPQTFPTQPSDPSDKNYHDYTVDDFNEFNAISIIKDEKTSYIPEEVGVIDSQNGSKLSYNFKAENGSVVLLNFSCFNIYNGKVRYDLNNSGHYNDIEVYLTNIAYTGINDKTLNNKISDAKNKSEDFALEIYRSDIVIDLTYTFYNCDNYNGLSVVSGTNESNNFVKNDGGQVIAYNFDGKEISNSQDQEKLLKNGIRTTEEFYLDIFPDNGYELDTIDLKLSSEKDIYKIYNNNGLCFATQDAIPEENFTASGVLFGEVKGKIQPISLGGKTGFRIYCTANRTDNFLITVQFKQA